MQYCSSSLSKGYGAKHWQLFLGVFLFALFVIPFSVQAQLSCSVKSSCSGEVEVFHMASTSDAHAEMPGQTAYSYRVCCGGVSGLGTSCSGNYDTVLKLSSATNAHVQISSYSDYPNSVCLSVSAGAIDCTYASSCGSGYACLATISSDTNAHVADCGAGGYGTKVCCGLLCANECSSSGQRQCSGSNSYQTCGNYDADSCLEWGSATSCGTSTCAADSCTGATYYDYPALGSSTQGTCSNTCSGGSCQSCSCTPATETCSPSKSCASAANNCAGGTVERCHMTNSGAWQWDTSLGTETACSDGYDNDCDGRADCQLGNEDTDCNCCNFASASITPNCGGGPCGIGDMISMSGSISGSGCSSFNFFQIDASGSACTIAYSGGDISGISQANPSIVGGSVSGTWTISSIPADCSSRTVSATGSGLYIGNPSSYSRAVFAGSSSGSFTFEDVLESNTVLNPYTPDPTNDNTPTYTGTASDSSSNIQAVQYRIDGGSWQNAQPSDGSFNSPNEGFTFTPSAVADGTHTFETRAQDAAGNWETSYAPDTLRIDTVPPSATVNTPSAWTNQLSFSVSWSGSDPPPGSGISGYNIQYKVAWTSGSLVRDWTDWLNPTVPGSQAFGPSSPATVQNNQTYSFRARATDNAGNTGSYSAAAASTTFDSELPQIIYNVNDDKENKVFSITSAASDNISGIFNHTINCIVANPPPGQAPIVFVQCPPGTPFGGVSSCQTTPGISYEEDTEVNCVIMAEDRAGNIYSTSIFFSGSEQIVKLSEHTIFISMGETHHGRVYVRNIKSYADNFSITITGMYPSGFARFLDSSSIIWMSLDKRNITVSLKPYEQKTLYLEITSTDVGEYTLEVSGASQKNPLLTGVDGMNIIIGFPAAFPGIEVLSITAILLISGLAYFRYLRRENQI